MNSDDPIRQRLVLLTTPLADDEAEEAIKRALSGGDVASVLIDPAGREHAAFQIFAEKLVPIVQEAGAAAIIVDNTQIAGRTRADGIHLTDGNVEALADAIEAHAPKLIVGGSGFETRHSALEAGEAMPDYLLFGRLGQDAEETPHPKTLSMAEWWAAMVELPCIALGARTFESVEAVAETGAEFIGLSAFVFDAKGEEDARVTEANRLLQEKFEREKAEARERANA
ncbi:thiamine phosphate synthase [Fulvimarina sp. MAC3]|uniref:thiamine phosphate synthase n=1 Tax=Fulvimarina sp. MAC3 TaxID=3148887 RepID=UPI0031FD64A7